MKLQLFNSRLKQQPNRFEDEAQLLEMLTGVSQDLAHVWSHD